MKHFYTLDNTFKNEKYFCHFGDIDYVVVKDFGYKIYTPYTRSGMLFSITEKEGGEEFYNKWIEFKKEYYASK